MNNMYLSNYYNDKMKKIIHKIHLETNENICIYFINKRK